MMTKEDIIEFDKHAGGFSPFRLCFFSNNSPVIYDFSHQESYVLWVIMASSKILDKFLPRFKILHNWGFMVDKETFADMMMAFKKQKQRIVKIFNDVEDISQVFDKLFQQIFSLDIDKNIMMVHYGLSFDNGFVKSSCPCKICVNSPAYKNVNIYGDDIKEILAQVYLFID